MDTQLQEAVTEAITESNDKTVEIRPANASKGRGKFSLLALSGGVLAVGYWLRKSQQPSAVLQSAATETAERTQHVTEQAAETIQESGETVAQRVEEGSQKAGEQVQQTGEKADEEAEEAAEKADESESSATDSSAGT